MPPIGFSFTPRADHALGEAASGVANMRHGKQERNEREPTGGWQ